MTRDELKNAIKPLFDVYGSKMDMPQATFDVWYRHLGEYDPGVIRKAIDAHIDASAFPPAISDIKKISDELNRERINENKYINAMWQHIIDCRPQFEATKAARNYFDEYLETYDKFGNRRLDGARKVFGWVENYTGDKNLEEMMKVLCEKSKNQ